MRMTWQLTATERWSRKWVWTIIWAVYRGTIHPSKLWFDLPSEERNDAEAADQHELQTSRCSAIAAFITRDDCCHSTQHPLGHGSAATFRGWYLELYDPDDWTQRGTTRKRTPRSFRTAAVVSDQSGQVRRYFPGGLSASSRTWLVRRNSFAATHKSSSPPPGPEPKPVASQAAYCFPETGANSWRPCITAWWTHRDARKELYWLWSPVKMVSTSTNSVDLQAFSLKDMAQQDICR